MSAEYSSGARAGWGVGGPSMRTPQPYPYAAMDGLGLSMFGRPRARRARLWGAVGPAIVALALAAAACSGGTATTASPGSLPTSATSLPTVDIGQFRTMLASVRGAPVLLNVWASWCGPCITEAPALASLGKEYAGKVTFVGLDVEDTTSSARAFIAKYGWTFPNVADPTGAVRNGLGFVGQPVTVLFDATGKQVFALSGPITGSQIREALAKVS